jgi:hypothetical protein
VSLVGRARTHIAASEPAAAAAKGMLVRSFGLGGIFVRGEGMVVKTQNFQGT